MRNITTTLLYKWFDEIWTKGNREAIDDLMTENVIAHGIGDTGYIEGRESFKQFYDGFKSTLKDIKVEVEDVISQDDLECALCKVTAVDIASDNKVSFEGLCLAQIKDGKIAKGWNQYDFMKMYKQMGYELMPKQDAVAMKAE